MTLLFGNHSPWRLFLSFSKGGLSPLYRTPPFNVHRFLRANTRGNENGRNWGGASSNWVIDVSF